MELGATVCKPANPDCSSCPLASICTAYAHWQVYLDRGGCPDLEDAPRVTQYPSKKKAKAKREVTVAVVVVEVICLKEEPGTGAVGIGRSPSAAGVDAGGGDCVDLTTPAAGAAADAQATATTATTPAVGGGQRAGFKPAGKIDASILQPVPQQERVGKHAQLPAKREREAGRGAAQAVGVPLGAAPPAKRQRSIFDFAKVCFADESTLCR